MLNETTLSSAIEHSATWRDAVDDFIACTTQIGQPFTSGHITTILRVYRPELRFSHREIGEYCQDLFHTGQVRYQGLPAVRVPRTCAGLGRTPVGTGVAVYAGEEDAADQFPFELDIPKPGAGLTQMPKEHPIQTQPSAGGVILSPNLPSPIDMRAIVHADHRLCVPRAAFEALIHATGKTLRGGAGIWVRFDDKGLICITLDQQPGSSSYDLSSTRGRVLFPRPGGVPFVHGDLYQCEIVNNELVVDITKTV